jgi:hypothetical protein
MIHRFPMIRRCGVSRFLLAFVILPILPSIAQDRPAIRKSAADAISGNVKQQSEAISADAQRRMDLDTTRVEYTQVYQENEISPFLKQNVESQQVDIDLKKMRGYWQKKKEANEGKWMELENKLQDARIPELERRARVQATWDRVMNDTKSRMYAVRNGNLFNFFLDQIEVHSGFSASGTLAPSLLNELKSLDENMLRGLKFEVGAPGGAIEVSLTTPLPSVLQTSPYLLLAPEFKEQRERVITLASKVLGSHSSDEEKYLASEEYITAFEMLTKSFYLKYPDSARKKISTRQWHRLDDVDTFFRKLDQTVSRAADGAANGAVRPFTLPSILPSNATLPPFANFSFRTAFASQNRPPMASSSMINSSLSFEN